MNILSRVSETALITLKARVEEAQKRNPLIRDEKGIEILERIGPLMPAETWQRILERKMPRSLSSRIVPRAMQFDR